MRNSLVFGLLLWLLLLPAAIPIAEAQRGSSCDTGGSYNDTGTCAPPPPSCIGQECERAALANCSENPRSCEAPDDNVGCPEGSHADDDFQNGCAPDEWCEARFGNPNIGCSQPWCPPAITGRCNAYPDAKHDECSGMAYRSGGGYTCDPPYDVEVWVQDPCLGNTGTAMMRWPDYYYEYVWYNNVSKENETHQVYADQVGTLYRNSVTVATSTGNEASFSSTLVEGELWSGQVVSTYKPDARNMPPPGQRGPYTETAAQNQVYNCETPTTPVVARGTNCPPSLDVEWTVDTDTPQKVRNLQGFKITRYWAAESRTFFMALDNPWLTHDQDGNYVFHDLGITPNSPVRYALQADYGARGLWPTVPLLSGAATTADCPLPVITAITTDSGAPGAGNDAPTRLQNIGLSWTWTDWHDDFNTYYFAMGVIKKQMGLAGEHPTGVNQGNPTTPIDGDFAYFAPIRQAGDGTTYSWMDENVFSGIVYQYQVEVWTRLDIQRQPCLEQAPQDCLHSNTAAASTSGVPWPPPRLELETLPYVFRDWKAPQPPPGFYPDDLDDNWTKYGAGLFNMDQDNRDDYAPTTHYMIEWRDMGYGVGQCTFTKGQWDQWIGSLHYQPGLAYPDDFEKNNTPGSCELVEGQYMNITPYTASQLVLVYSFNAFGRSRPAYVEVAPWNPDTPMPDGRVFQGADVSTPRFPYERQKTGYVGFGREDVLVHRSAKAEWTPIKQGDYGVQEKPGLRDRLLLEDPSIGLEIPDDVLPAKHITVGAVGLEGVPCNLPAKVESTTRQSIDHRAIGRAVPIVADSKDLTPVWGDAYATAYNFDTRAGLEDAGDDLKGHPVRLHQYLDDHSPADRMANVTQLNAKGVGLHRLSAEMPNWVQMMRYWDGADFVGPLLPGQDASEMPFVEVPAFPFNAVGEYCWFDGVMFAGKANDGLLNNVASNMDLGLTEFEFKHKVAIYLEKREWSSSNSGLHGRGGGWWMFGRTDHMSEYHQLIQVHWVYETYHNDILQVGYRYPLDGSRILSFNTPMGGGNDFAEFSRGSGFLDPKLDDAMLAEMRSRNLDAAAQSRWDRGWCGRWIPNSQTCAHDAPPPEDVRIEDIVDGEYVKNAWVKLRPALGYVGPDDVWVAPDASIKNAPVAFIGGLDSIFTQGLQDAGYHYEFEYEWNVTYFHEDGSFWWHSVRCECNQTDMQPFVIAGQPSRLSYDQSNGTAGWTVKVSANIVAPNGTVVRTDVNLTDDDIKIRYLQPPDAKLDARWFGLPVAKEDITALQDTAYRFQWLADPEHLNVWDERAVLDDGGEAVYNPSLLMQGKTLAFDPRNQVEMNAPDPHWRDNPITSNEVPLGKTPVPDGPQPEGHDDRNDIYPAQLASFRANDTFTQIVYSQGDEPESPTQANFRLLNVRDLRAQLFGAIGSPPFDNAFMDEDGQAYVASEGDYLSYKMYSTTVYVVGEQMSPRTWNNMASDERQDMDEFSRNGLVLTTFTGDIEDTEERSGDTTTIQIGWNDPHPQSLNQWAQYTVDIPEGSQVTGLELRSEGNFPYRAGTTTTRSCTFWIWGCSTLTITNAQKQTANILYLDEVRLHSPANNKTWSLLDSDAVVPTVPRPMDNSENVGEAVLVQNILKTLQYGYGPNEMAPRPDDPFVEILGIRDPIAPYMDRGLEQPYAVYGLEAGEIVKGGTVGNVDSIGGQHYTALHGSPYFKEATPGDKAGAGPWRPVITNYYSRFQVIPTLAFDWCDPVYQGINTNEPCTAEPNLPHGTRGRDYDSCVRAPTAKVLQQTQGREAVATGDSIRSNWVCRGIPDFEHSYTTWQLVEGNWYTGVQADYRNYDTTAAGYPIQQLDGLYGVTTTVPIDLTNEALDYRYGISPMLPFESKKPVALDAGDSVPTIDLNARGNWSLQEIREEAMPYMDQQTSWLKIIPFKASIDVCTRYSEEDPWMNARDPRVEENKNATVAYVQIHYKVWADNPNTPYPGQAVDLCYDSNFTAAERRMSDGSNVSLNANQLGVILTKTVDAEGNEVINQEQVLVDENGMAEFTVALNPKTKGHRLSVTTIFENNDIWAQTTVSQIGDPLIRVAQAGGEPLPWDNGLFILYMYLFLQGSVWALGHFKNRLMA